MEESTKIILLSLIMLLVGIVFGQGHEYLVYEKPMYDNFCSDRGLNFKYQTWNNIKCYQDWHSEEGKYVYNKDLIRLSRDYTFDMNFIDSKYKDTLQSSLCK